MLDLRGMWDRQWGFTKDVLAKTRGLTLGEITGTDRTSVTEKYLLSLHKELDEVLDDLDWKEHRASEGLLLRENVLEEMVDIQKFLMGLFQIWDVTPEEFQDLFHAKSFVVEERWRMKQTELTDRVAVVDIDGVLYDHETAFRRWLAVNRPHMRGARKQDNALAWEEARWAYRMSHDKRHGEAHRDNIYVLQEMALDGWSVVLMTYRPRKLYQSLEYDTLYWLKENAVPCDRLVWAAYEKVFYMRQEFREATVFIDDEGETCRLVQSLGGPRVYHVTPLGQNEETCYTGVHRVRSLREMKDWEAGI